MNSLSAIFQTNKPIIGMIHLAGKNTKDKITRALEELTIYQEEGINGAIIEDYHGTPKDVYETLRESLRKGLKIVKGINILRDSYSAFNLASEFGARFIQFDSVQTPDLNLELYNKLRKKYPNIAVLGGIGFKYISPTGNPLEVDLREGKSRCEAIVTTGDGTGIETPTKKLREYKKLLGEFPLIVGAGINLDNVSEKLKICDGAIIGSYFKLGKDTHLPVDKKRVNDLMKIVKQLRD